MGLRHHTLIILCLKDYSLSNGPFITASTCKALLKDKVLQLGISLYLLLRLIVVRFHRTTDEGSGLLIRSADTFLLEKSFLSSSFWALLPA